MRLKRYIILAMVVVVGFLTACSPQRQLYRILLRHPELRAPDSVHVINFQMEIPGATNTILFPRIEDDPCNCDSLLREALKDGISTTAGNAQASVLPTDSGIVLQAQQLPDTIIIRDTTYIPEYIIKTVPREETNGEIFFRYSGYIAWSLVVLAVLIGILLLFLKR